MPNPAADRHWPGQLADLYALRRGDVMPDTLALIAEKLAMETDNEIQSLLNAAFARFGQEACSRKKYKAVVELCLSLEKIAHERPGIVQDLRSRVGIEIACPR